MWEGGQDPIDPLGVFDSHVVDGVSPGVQSEPLGCLAVTRGQGASVGAAQVVPDELKDLVARSWVRTANETIRPLGDRGVQATMTGSGRRSIERDELFVGVLAKHLEQPEAGR